MYSLGPPSACSAIARAIEHVDTEPETGHSRGWHSRGYVPHLNAPGVLQSVTFRLADSLPQERLRQLEFELTRLGIAERDRTRRLKIDRWLDSGMGCCVLSHTMVAEIVENSLLHFDGQRYRLACWSIMPNHVHVLVEPLIDLGRIVQTWKSFTTRRVMELGEALGLAIPGPRLWMRDYWDRYIRDEAHFRAVVNYVHENPVKAGLVKTPEEWRWSSAWRMAR